MNIHTILLKGSIWLLCLTLSACQTLEFESLPQGKVQECDPSWVGDWQYRDEDNTEVLIRIDAQCSNWLSVEKPDDSASAKAEPVFKDGERIRFVETDHAHYLAVQERAKKESDAPSAQTWILVRYQASKNGFELFEGDRERADRLIRKGQLRGSIWYHNTSTDPSNSSGAQHRVVVFGDEQAIAQALHKHPLFKNRFARLTRANAEQTALLTQTIAKSKQETDTEQHKDE